MFLRIHTEAMWLVPLIKFDTKALFGLETELLYLLSYTNQCLFTLYIMLKMYDKYIEYSGRKNTFMMMGVVSLQSRRLERFIIQNITRHNLIEIMFLTEFI